jgi:hypothetical protein
VNTYPNTEGPESTQTEILVYQTARHYMLDEYLHGYIKATPLHATIHRLQEDVQSYPYKTPALGVKVFSFTPRPLYARSGNPVAILQDNGRAMKAVWTGTEYLAHTGFRISESPTQTESLC